MSIFDVVLLALAGLLAGAINSVAGGGTFFTFSALLTVGLPPIVANATSSIAVGPGSIASAFAYVPLVKRYARQFFILGVVSAGGSFVGSLTLLKFSNDAFSRLVPYLLLGATLLFAASPYLARITRRAEPKAEPSRLNYVGGLLLQFFIAIYGGFFGAGMGIVMLASLALTQGSDFHLNNATKNVLAVFIQAVAVVIFVASGVIRWLPALIVMAACIVGGYSGVRIARRVPVKVIRGFVIAVGLLLTVYYFLRPA